MRFEGKHQFIKQRITGNYNFKNVQKTIAERCAMYECALNIGKNHLLFKNDKILGKVLRVQNVDNCKESIHAFFGTDVNSIESVHAVSWVIY